MASIINHAEETADLGGRGRKCRRGRCSGGSFAGLVSGPAPEGTVLAESTRMHWARRLVELELAKRKFRIEDFDTNDGPSLVFRLDHPLDRDLIPWTWAPNGPRGGEREPGGEKTVPGYYSFFTENSKMLCPTWDLPSGSPSIGGACPGATAAQLLLDPVTRDVAARKSPPPPGWGEGTPPPNGWKYDDAGKLKYEIDPLQATCAQCYATTAQYAAPVVQAGEVLRLWWTRDCLDRGAKGADEFVEAMVYALRLELKRKAPEISGGNPVKPIRVHSSGDMFHPDYFALWVRIANAIAKEEPLAIFWAPTRVWADRIYEGIGKLKQDNLIVRASSYHTSDPAPEEILEGHGRGTAALYWSEDLGPRDELFHLEHPHAQILHRYNRKQKGENRADGRYDWACQTYAIALDLDKNGEIQIEPDSGLPKVRKDKELGADLSHSCQDAIGPDGKPGCRACWDRPDLRVHFTVH